MIYFERVNPFYWFILWRLIQTSLCSSLIICVSLEFHARLAAGPFRLSLVCLILFLVFMILYNIVYDYKTMCTLWNCVFFCTDSLVIWMWSVDMWVSHQEQHRLEGFQGDILSGTIPACTKRSYDHHTMQKFTQLHRVHPFSMNGVK